MSDSPCCITCTVSVSGTSTSDRAQVVQLTGRTTCTQRWHQCWRFGDFSVARPGWGGIGDGLFLRSTHQNDGNPDSDDREDVLIAWDDLVHAVVDCGADDKLCGLNERLDLEVIAERQLGCQQHQPEYGVPARREESRLLWTLLRSTVIACTRRSAQHLLLVHAAPCDQTSRATLLHSDIIKTYPEIVSWFSCIPLPM